MAETLWDWSLRVYRGDVPDILIDLQDAHGQHVPLLLWAAWCAREGVSVRALVPKAIGIARAWDDVITPLRTARRRLKSMDHETLRTAVKVVELQAEKALLDALPRGSQGGSTGGSTGIGEALTAVATAWSPGYPPEKLVRLTEGLSET